jgi:hypothetical protein
MPKLSFNQRENAGKTGRAGPVSSRAMAEERTLWDYSETGPDQAEQRGRQDRQQSRRATFRKLRAGGHWLILLRVARTIPQPFTLNDISVAVWKACPEFFAMKGYPYPDNHKVHSILYGDRGLIARGLLERVSTGLFRIPEGVDPSQLVAEPATDAGDQVP